MFSSVPPFCSPSKSHATSPTHGHCGDEHGGHGHINAHGVHGLDIDISAIFLTVRNSDQPLSNVYS